jgi:hypothetical protein
LELEFYREFKKWLELESYLESESYEKMKIRSPDYYTPDKSAEVTKSHQCLKYATLFTSTSSMLPKYSQPINFYSNYFLGL